MKTEMRDRLVKNIESQPLCQIKLDSSKASCSQKKSIFCPTGRYRVSENIRAQVAKDFRFYISAEVRVCDHNKYFTITISTYGLRFLLKQVFAAD